MKHFAFIREWLASLLCCPAFSSSSATSSTRDLKSEASLASSATSTPYLDEMPTESAPEFSLPSLSDPSPAMSSPGLSRRTPLGDAQAQPAAPPRPNWDPQPRMKIYVDLANIRPQDMSGRHWFWEECQNEADGCENWVWVMGSACHECTKAGSYTDGNYFAGVRHKHELYHPATLSTMEESRRRIMGITDPPTPRDQAFWDLPGADPGGYESGITSFWNSAIKKHRGDPAAGIPAQSLVTTLNLYI